MKNNHVSFVYGMVAILLLFSSCRKDSFEVEPLPGQVSNFQYAAQGGNVKVSWDKPAGGFDNYEIELSRFEDFSVNNQAKVLDKDATEYTFYKLATGEVYYSRIRMVSNKTNERSGWSTVMFNTMLDNILLPITQNAIAGTAVTLTWQLPANPAAGASTKVNRVVLKPILGEGREVQLSPQDIESKTLRIEGLEKDMKYTVTLYDGNLARGVQSFATLAEAVNGVWTISPYSDLPAIIANSKDGDKIMMRQGIYNLSTTDIILNNKSITFQALEPLPAKRPQLYARSFELNGSGLSISFIGLDISGARLDEYKKELADLPNHSWNSRLLTLNTSATSFNAVLFDGCIIRNYLTGVFNMNDTNRTPHKVGNILTINNCIIHHTGKDNKAELLAINAGELKKAVISNSTFNEANRMLLKIDAEKNTANNVIDFTFKNNTVNNSWSAGAFDFKALKAPAKFTLENNIFSNITATGNFFANFAYTANNFDKKLINTNFYNVLSKATIYGSNQSNQPVSAWELRHPNMAWNEVRPAFIMNDASHENPNSIKEYPVNFDPGYANPATGDFTVSSGSPLRNLDGGKAIGDPRWW